MRLNTYQDWRECIEVRCGIPLTPAFISERIAELKNSEDPKTREFEGLYGKDHLQQTIDWFERAAEEAL